MDRKNRRLSQLNKVSPIYPWGTGILILASATFFIFLQNNDSSLAPYPYITKTSYLVYHEEDQVPSPTQDKIKTLSDSLEVLSQRKSLSTQQIQRKRIFSQLLQQYRSLEDIEQRLQQTQLNESKTIQSLKGRIPKLQSKIQSLEGSLNP